MNNNQIKQQIKSDPRGKAIASLILGFVSVISGIGAIYIYGSYDWSDPVLIVYSLFPLVGILLGKIGIRSTKKGLAITGIILSIISLIGTLLIWLFIWGLSKGF